MAPKDDLRAGILAASLELIAKDGLSALSFREVARRAGVSHQAPYHHFGDRQGILAALAEEGFRRLADALENASLSSKMKAAGRFDAGGRAYVTFAREHPEYFRIMFRPELVDVDDYPEAAAQSARAYGALEKLVAGVIAEGLVPAARAPGLTLLAWGFVHGVATLAIDGPLAKMESGGGTADGLVDAGFETFAALLKRR